MIIESMHVRNFRCIRNQTLYLDNLVALVGPNGAGKSSFLRALDLFYEAKADYSEADFYDGDASEPIRVSVTFSQLSERELALFSKYVRGSKLTVEKVMGFPSYKSNQSYHGEVPRNPEFASFRSASGQDYRREYNKLSEDGYSTLPEYSNHEAGEKALQKWEESHPEKCNLEADDGKFFGFHEVGNARLERFTKFVFIRAVHDAIEEAEEKRGGALEEIMELVVKETLRSNDEIQGLRERMESEYRDIMDPKRIAELASLEGELNGTLQIYAPNCGLRLDWPHQTTIEIPLPMASVKLVEDNYVSQVQACGHGLQRAFILSMFQYLAFVRSRSDIADQNQTENGEKHEPDFIIAIEEPELYQHPNRQRHLARVLLQLSKESMNGMGNLTQIIYSTHSPLFVDIARFESIRRLGKVDAGDDSPKESKIVSVSLDEVANIIGRACDKEPGEYTGETLRPRLQTLMTPWMNEGFFADVAVLVEGEEDRALVLAAAEQMGFDVESKGVSVIPCMGKNNLDRPTVIFRELGIPVYTVWDSDHGGNDPKPEVNRRLLKLMGVAEEDWPDTIDDSYACFKTDLASRVRSEIGEELYDSSLEECCTELGYPRKHGKKNPVVMRGVLNYCKEKKRVSQSLSRIIEKISDLTAT